MDMVATQPETLTAPQYCQCAPTAGRHSFFHACPVQSAPITPRHFRGDAALVNKDKLRRIDLSGFHLPELALCFDSFTVPLGGVE